MVFLFHRTPLTTSAKDGFFIGVFMKTIIALLLLISLNANADQMQDIQNYSAEFNRQHSGYQTPFKQQQNQLLLQQIYQIRQHDRQDEQEKTIDQLKEEIEELKNRSNY